MEFIPIAQSLDAKDKRIAALEAERDDQRELKLMAIREMERHLKRAQDVEAERDRLRKALEEAKRDICRGCYWGWPIDSAQEPPGQWHSLPENDSEWDRCRAYKIKAALAAKGE